MIKMADDVLTKDELAQIDKELETLKASISGDAVAKAKQEGRLEALKEAEIQKKLEEKDRRLQELENSLAQQKELAEKGLKEMQEKINNLATSKGGISIKDPFSEKGTRAEGFNPDKLTDEEIRRIEEESARAFFGPDYDRMKRDFTGNY
jgi:chromosome segregation ATPase